MKEFIENFEESKQKELANIAETEQTIVALLEHISHGLESSEVRAQATRICMLSVSCIA